ncbi:MAG: terminase family protein [Bryobacterales bacterium]|nr:terminase family protein [Bryobacterales bacterium]
MCLNAANRNYSSQIIALPTPTTPTEAPENIVEWATAKLGFTPTAKQAEILESDAKYLILCCNRQWGKTTTIAAKALYAGLQTPKLKIVILSRSKDQASLMLAKIAEFVAALLLPTRRVLGQSHSLLLPNGTSFCAVPHTISTTYGRTANVFIVDEAAEVSDAVYRAASAFVGHTHGKIWLLSAPTRQSGFFFNYWHDLSGQWHRVFSNVHDCPDIDPDFLAMEERADPIAFSRNFLCQFTPPANRLCSREMAMAILLQKGDDRPCGAGIVNYLRGAAAIPAPRKYIALDLGQRFDHSAIAAIEVTWRHLGRDPYLFTEQYQAQMRITSLHRFPVGLSYEKTYELVMERLSQEHQNLELIVDAGGPGPPVVDRLRASLPSHIVLKPVIITGGKGQNTLTGGYIGIPRRSLLSTLLMTMTVGSIICEEGTPGWDIFVSELVELSGATTHPAGGAMHDDLVMAVTLAVHAAVRDTPSLLPGQPSEPETKTRRTQYGHQPNRLL